ncbi:hypothetical protein KI387_011753, partial [Taxus chinensis]
GWAGRNLVKVDFGDSLGFPMEWTDNGEVDDNAGGSKKFLNLGMGGWEVVDGW